MNAVAYLLLFWALYRLADALIVAWEMRAPHWESTPIAVYCPRCGAYRGERCRGLREEYHVARETLMKTRIGS